MTPPSDPFYHLSPVPFPSQTNILSPFQKSQSKGAPRLGLPPYAWWSEGLHGVAGSPGVVFNTSGSPFSFATSFANAITLGATFDDSLVHEVGSAISTEARAFANFGFGGLDYWTPNINPYKDPRWGRGAETPGEDPLRIKGYVKAMVAGLEGEEGKSGGVRKVIATCKHFAAYDLERWKGLTRYEFDAVVSLQDLSEYYLPPFQECARDSKVGSIMCRYVSFFLSLMGSKKRLVELPLGLTRTTQLQRSQRHPRLRLHLPHDRHPPRPLELDRPQQLHHLGLQRHPRFPAQRAQLHPDARPSRRSRLHRRD